MSGQPVDLSGLGALIQALALWQKQVAEWQILKQDGVVARLGFFHTLQALVTRVERHITGIAFARNEIANPACGELQRKQRFRVAGCTQQTVVRFGRIQQRIFATRCPMLTLRSLRKCQRFLKSSSLRSCCFRSLRVPRAQWMLSTIPSLTLRSSDFDSMAGRVLHPRQ